MSFKTKNMNNNENYKIMKDYKNLVVYEQNTLHKL